MTCFIFFPFKSFWAGLPLSLSQTVLSLDWTGGRDKPNSVGFLCRVQLVHSLHRMLLLVEPPPASWVFLEHRSLSHGDTHSLRLWVHSSNVCLLSWWQTPCFPGWAWNCRCVTLGTHPANRDNQEFGDSLCLVPGTSTCAPSLPRALLDHWISVPLCQLHSGKWWKGFLYFFF